MSQWQCIDPSTALARDRVLWDAQAHLFQFAFWNEPLREFYGRPLYLQLGDGPQPRASAAVMTFGVPGFRVGLLQRGPVVRPSEQPSVIPSLAAFLQRRGVFCLRITSHDPALLDDLSRAWESERVDTFPFMSSLHNEGLVSLDLEREALLRRFQAQIRQQIRRCERSDFTLETYTEPEDLKRFWYLFEATATQKRFVRRPLSSFCRLFELGAGKVELCVLRAGDCAIGALILASDATTTYYISGGRDEVLSKEFAYTAHYRLWIAMLRAKAAGAMQFNLGAVTGPLGRFKMKFAPEVRVNPPPVTLILLPARYRLWKLATRQHRVGKRMLAFARQLASSRGRA